MDGGQQFRQGSRGNDTVEHGGIDRIDEPVSNGSTGIQQTVGCQHGKPVAHHHDTEHRHAEKARKLQIGSQENPPAQSHSSFKQGAHQQWEGNQGHNQCRHQRTGHAGNHMGYKPVFSSQRKCMEHIAHAAGIQVAEEQGRHDGRIDQIHQGHDLHQIRHVPGKVILLHVAAVGVHQQDAHHQTQGVHTPDRSKPEQILPEYGCVKAGCP